MISNPIKTTPEGYHFGCVESAIIQRQIMMIGAGFYRWAQHFERQPIPSTVEQNLDEVLSQVAEAGIESFESLWNSETKYEIYVPALPKHGVKMASIYVPCNLMQDDIDVETPASNSRSKTAPHSRWTSANPIEKARGG